MATVLLESASIPERLSTLDQLVESLGSIPLSRIVSVPPPGMATEAHLIAFLERGDGVYELVDGTLVRKAMGFRESCLALRLGRMLDVFVEQRNLGRVTAPDGLLRLRKGLSRAPDVSFISWERLPEGVDEEAIPEVAPDLAVEILSRSNTPAEISRKVGEYFAAGTRLAWVVDHRRRTVRVYTGPGRSVLLMDETVLDGGDVLPGFRLPLSALFELPRRPG